QIVFFALRNRSTLEREKHRRIRIKHCCVELVIVFSAFFVS
ncbi:unnamed protein product, partial [marine sediment metagenome]